MAVNAKLWKALFLNPVVRFSELSAPSGNRAGSSPIQAARVSITAVAAVTRLLEPHDVEPLTPEDVEPRGEIVGVAAPTECHELLVLRILEVGVGERIGLRQVLGDREIGGNRRRTFWYEKNDSPGSPARGA